MGKNDTIFDKIMFSGTQGGYSECNLNPFSRVQRN